MISILIVTAVVVSLIAIVTVLPFELWVLRKSLESIGLLELVAYARDYIAFAILGRLAALLLVSAIGFSLGFVVADRRSGIPPAIFGAFVYEYSPVLQLKSGVGGPMLLAPNLIWLWMCGAAMSWAQRRHINSILKRSVDASRQARLRARLDAASRTKLFIPVLDLVVFLIACMAILYT